MLCDYFELPDLGTRSGLKKVHSEFNDIYKKLDRAYTSNRDNPRIMGGIVGIWAKMSADAILRDKLFKEGFLARLVPLLDIALTRHVALQALSTVTHHGGFEARRDIAQEAPRLVRLMEEQLDDTKLVELCIVTLAHSVGTTVGSDDKFNMKVIKPSDMRKLLEVTIKCIQNPSASHYMIDHALSLLCCVTLRFPTECKDTPSMLKFLVACLRSTNICARSSAIGALIRLHNSEAELDRPVMDPIKLMATAGRRWPDNLVDDLMDYGFNRCETIVTLTTMREYQNAMMEVVQTGDLRALGRTLASFITRTEYSVGDGAFQMQDPRTGQIKVEDVGLPFVRWRDAPLHCAKALRATGKPADLDAADILEIKHHIMRQSIPDAIEVGQVAMQRNPQLAYAYYPLGLGANDEQGLRGTKKGLKCKQITPFVRNYLLWRAVEHAGNLGISALQEEKGDGKESERGVAFLMSAYEDAKAFIASVPPDSRNLGAMADWLVILTLAIRGPELDADLHELKPIMNKISFADRCATFLGNPPKRTLMRLTRELILRLYPDASKEWADTIARFDSLGSVTNEQLVDAEKAEDDLAVWLENLHMEDGETHVPERCTHPRISTNSIELYRCSWCKNPSAVLRKCGGCGRTRYCDGVCQKSHWSEHKAACKSA
ncbi:hypothetical protein CERSUDRAFT_112416 [Gelatoporia subvermispora B]|uniref:MYND-type domain-containing protein n=1 Tax=Ceriporiopsis subvermispora (strain B) TaxID=914234 RepID=M2RP40_CERS8|nr:hypothetical protein CERSUDRAFT_112416 [Gelatoporia subvermispora B]